jgi:uncharacterized protein
MTGVDFIDAIPPRRVNPLRADIACFVGYVKRRAVKPLSAKEDDNKARLGAMRERLPEWLFDWLRERGWLPPEGRCSGAQYERLVTLKDIPAPIESWDAFDALFEWEARPLDRSTVADTYLGAAVRSFFRSGGRSCVVVRLDDPLPFSAPGDKRVPLQEELVRGATALSVDRESWRGVGHLLGLPEVSILCVPDLPDLVATDPPPLPPPTISPGEERFIECAAQSEPASVDSLVRVAPPRCDANGFGSWAKVVSAIGRFVERNAREVIFVSALPLCVDENAVHKRDGFYALPFAERQKKINDELKTARDAQWTAAASIQTAFVQLTYPWLRTRDSGTLPGDLEPPDGALAGVLANISLTRGAWRTAARESASWLLAVDPILSRKDLDRELGFADDAQRGVAARERLSLFGPTSSGLRLLSDVTTDDDEHWRPGSTVRLMNLLVRAARLAGEQFIFSNNGEELWGRLRRAMEGLLSGLWAEGALLGTTAANAFEVRCDRSTMTQADIDAGRVIVRVAFTVAAPITRIVVSLVVIDSGQISLALEREAA